MHNFLSCLKEKEYTFDMQFLSMNDKNNNETSGNKGRWEQNWEKSIIAVTISSHLVDFQTNIYKTGK